MTLPNQKTNAQLYDAFRTTWAGRIDEKGAQYAYEEFKKEYETAHFGIQHGFAHIFGELLYEKMGIAGITICDDNFSFGCYHSFFAMAINDRGLDVLDLLDRECIKKWGEKGLGCPHGIGHAILSYVGEDNIREALELCRRLSWKGPIGGCTSGVFMEYNFRTMADPTGSQIPLRPLDLKNPHAPCSFLPDIFLESCYFEQPQWWEKIFQRDYVKLGVLCNELKEMSQREACFRGIGNVAAPSSGYDVAKTLALCQKMPLSQAEILCRAGASWSFFANPQYRSLSLKLCEGIEIDAQDFCVKKADVIGVN